MGTCKHCQKPTFTDAEGKVRHDKRAATAPPPTPAPPNEETEPETPPAREHPLHRRIGGRKE